jgi:hypothetical protein
LEFVPRGLEDSILDETIGMLHTVPPHKPKLEQRHHSPPPSPVPDSSVPAFQQSSDEEESLLERELKELSASELSSSEDEELPNNLVARPPSPPIPASPAGKSPRRSPRQRKKVSLENLQKHSLTKSMKNPQNTPDLSLDDDVSINSEEYLGGFKPPLHDGKNHVRFADEVDVNQFSRLGASLYDELFYASLDLAEFRYEAFMEEAGLDIADYD